VTAHTLWNGDQDVTAWFTNVTYLPGTLTVTGNSAPIIITAASDYKAYDGTPLVNPNYTTNPLPAGVTEVRATVVGSQTQVGSSSNNVTAHTLWNGTQDVTAWFPNVTYIPGALTVVANVDAAITIFANSDSKVYDATALTNGGFTHTALPAGVTEVRATVSGSQTNAGGSANTITTHTLWNGTQNVTAYFTNVVYVDGTLTVTKKPVTITAASDEKAYDGTALTADRSAVTAGSLVPGHRYTVTIFGSQTDVGQSANVAVVGSGIILDAAGNNVSAN